MANLFGYCRSLGVVTHKCLSRVLQTVDKSCHPAISSWLLKTEGLHYKVPWIPQTPAHQVEVPDYTKEDEKLAADVTQAINAQIAANKTGRLFAVIQLCGKQFKITESDIIITEGYWPPSPGDKLKLEKVLLVGGTDFTLVGRPILNRELVSVNATVIEKTFSHIKPLFRFKKRKQYRRLNFLRVPRTMLRINSIDILGNIDEKKTFEGLDRIY